MATTYDINYFIFEIDITKDNTVIQLKNNRRGDTTEWDNITYWGDGTSDTNTTHTYNIGKYTIKSKLFTYRDNESGVNSNRYVTNVFSINKNITDCYRLFYDCNKLTSLDVSNFDTSNVTNMYAMFSNCLSLTSLDVSNFNTSNVTDMRSMFNNCRLLTSLDLSNFDTSNVVTMYTMFNNCRSLTSLNVSSFNTSKVTTMAEMFENCSKLTSLDLSNFNTSNLTNMDSMFYGCGSLTSLDLSNFNTSKVTNMSAMFYNCNKLTSLDLSNFNTSKVNNMNSMFNGCTLLTALDLSNFDTIKVNNMGYMFCNCNKLTSLDLSNFNTSNVISMLGMFRACSSLTSLDVSNFNTSKVNNMRDMFYDCTSLSSLNISNFNTSNVNNMGYMFNGCSSLTSLNLSNFNTSKVQHMFDMFSGCTSLTSLDLSNFNTINVTNMSYMFYDCTLLSDIGMVYCNKATIDKVSLLIQHTANIYVNSVIPENCTPVEGITFIFDGNIKEMTHEPLRAVGDVKDRYVLIDGKWYIERNFDEVVLDGSMSGISRRIMNNENNTIGFGIHYTYFPNRSESNAMIISDTLPTVLSGDYTWSTDIPVMNFGDFLQFRLPINELVTQDEEGCKQWLQQNPITVVYQSATPQYEPIDYNPLETYSEVTHITTNSAIPTNITVRNHGYNMVALKENTQYTLYVNKDTTNALTYRLGDYIEINSPSKFTFTTPETLTDKTLRIDGKGAKVNDLMLIEGTPTNDSIGYFDGLKSSYECEQVTDENDENYGKYKVDVKVVGKNLCNRDKIKRGFYYKNVYKNSEYSICYRDYLKVKPNTVYTITISNYSHLIYTEVFDKNFRCIAEYNKKTITIPEQGTYLRFCTHSSADHAVDINNITVQIEEGNTATEYEPYFESKQTIYLNSPLLKGDEIVWKDNKIQHYHKMGRVILDGSDDEIINLNADRGNLIEFIVSELSIPNRTGVKYVATTLPNVEGFVEKIVCGYQVVYIQLQKARLQSADVSGFKQWLQANPITVVHELKTPYYEEISDYPLKLNVIANSSLSTESTIQVTNISFNIYEETLPYLYPNTKYYITFNSDVDRNNIVIDLGGNHVVFDCKVGFNKVEITTPSDTTNLLTFSGTGVNIDHVKVTQQDIDEYFEGMKSVGECEELVITSANSDNTLSNAQQLTHEPLRAVGDVKDRYVIIDGKWYIERNCKEFILTDSLDYSLGNTSSTPFIQFTFELGSSSDYTTTDKIICNRINTTNVYTNNTNIGICYVKNDTIRIRLTNSDTLDSFKAWLNQDLTVIIYKLQTPIYEPINYNPFETYADTTHITTNSLIPTNVVVKNHGYNCILKPSTKYTIALNKPNGTISAKLGGSAKVDSTNSIFTITTPSTLNDNVLRLSGSGNVKDIMILEGDKTINTPSYFKGIESGFEQEYDTEKGRYRVTARVEGNGKESSIIFYLNEPLRGTATAKDKVFIQDDKVVVERNCAITTVDGSEDVGYIFGGINKTVKYRILKRLDTILVDNATVLNILSNKLPTNNLTIWANVDIPCISLDSQGDIVLRTYVADTGVNKNSIKQYLQTNPITIVYELAEPVYEEAECDLSKLVLENYENSSLVFESNIPVSANIRYSGEVPVVTQAKALSSKVDNTTLDINENIIPYMCDIDYRIVELQLMNGDTQGEGIELLGIGDIEILSNENVLFNNREDKKYNYSYDMLKRDILSQRYSKEEYQYRLDRYLLANKISDEEYKELEGLLNNGK